MRGQLKSSLPNGATTERRPSATTKASQRGHPNSRVAVVKEEITRYRTRGQYNLSAMLHASSWVFALRIFHKTVKVTHDIFVIQTFETLDSCFLAGWRLFPPLSDAKRNLLRRNLIDNEDGVNCNRLLPGRLELHQSCLELVAPSLRI